MNISVIIPTLNRADYLGQCLAALKAEIEGRDGVEIIVVDDGSRPEQKQEIQKICAVHKAICLEHIHNRGMAVARNTGLVRATGEWVVFIDDDICVEKGWGAALQKTLDAAGPDVVGIEGAVTGSGGNLWDREVEVRSGGLCLTCHIIYRSDALAKAGNFDPAFEHEGPFHEDQELAIRVRQWGRIVFEPMLRAIHLPRQVRLRSHLRDAPARVEKLLKADFYFWSKHPAAYHDFRHAKSFWGTYAAVLFKYPFVTMKRRPIHRLLLHPVQTVMLALSCVAAQVRAWTLVWYFFKRTAGITGPTTVWFAAAIPESSQGGVNRLMTGLASGLSQQGIRTMIVYHGEHGAQRATRYIAFSLNLGIRLLCRPFNRPDWIIGRSTDTFFCSLAKRLFRLKTRIILQNHGWEEYVHAIQKRLPASRVEHSVSWKSHLLRFPMLRATLAMADFCLCGTVDDIRWIRTRYPARRAKLRYVPNGIDPQPSCYWATQPEIPPYFLCVGTMTWRKNLAFAIELFRALLDIRFDARLYLVGTGAVSETLTVAGHGRIVVVPLVPMAEMETWYKKCPYILHTARYEGGHPLALLEAMSFGAVPFVTPIPPVREIVKNGLNGQYLDGTDARMDAGTIAAAIENRPLIMALGTRAFGTASRNRWPRQADRLKRVIDQS
jgi:glycosyltransferase involved in cell wall biosynthesis